MHYRKPYFLFIFEYDSKKGQGNNADLCRIYEREERLYGKNTIEISCLAHKVQTHCLKIKLREIRIQTTRDNFVDNQNWLSRRTGRPRSYQHGSLSFCQSDHTCLTRHLPASKRRLQRRNCDLYLDVSRMTSIARAITSEPPRDSTS